MINNILSRLPKRSKDFLSNLLLILQILYFGSIAPKALLLTARYISIPESNPAVEILSDLVDKGNPNLCSEKEKN